MEKKIIMQIKFICQRPTRAFHRRFKLLKITLLAVTRVLRIQLLKPQKPTRNRHILIVTNHTRHAEIFKIAIKQKCAFGSAIDDEYMCAAIKSTPTRLYKTKSRKKKNVHTQKQNKQTGMRISE